MLERVKNELDKQIAAAKLLDKKVISSTPLNVSKEEEDEDLDYDDNLSESYLKEDYQSSFNSCAFISSNEKQCLTNSQVYNLLKKKSDLIKFSKTIEQQINIPNEQMCTSIDLSKLLILFEH